MAHPCVSKVDRQATPELGTTAVGIGGGGGGGGGLASSHIHRADAPDEGLG